MYFCSFNSFIFIFSFSYFFFLFFFPSFNFFFFFFFFFFFLSLLFRILWYEFSMSLSTTTSYTFSPLSLLTLFLCKSIPLLISISYSVFANVTPHLSVYSSFFHHIHLLRLPLSAYFSPSFTWFHCYLMLFNSDFFLIYVSICCNKLYFSYLYWFILQIQYIMLCYVIYYIMCY